MDHSYFCRITPDPDKQSFYTLSILAAYLSTLSDKYFICYENAKRPHYHFLLYTSMSSETLRARLKKNLYAQVYISGKEVIDQIKAIAYCMKDGAWTQSGIDINTLLMASATTKRKVKFDDVLEEVIKDYETSLIKDDKKLIGGIIDAHVRCNRKVYIQHIRALTLLLKLKVSTDGRTRQYLIDKIIDDI